MLGAGLSAQWLIYCLYYGKYINARGRGRENPRNHYLSGRRPDAGS